MATEKQIERMVQVARMYYEQEMTQSQIAKELGISRPLVSVILSEARTCGIVTIQINPVENKQQLTANRLQQLFPGKTIVVVPDEGSSDATDNAIAKVGYSLCFKQLSDHSTIGVGWGSMLSRLSEYTELAQMPANTGSSLFPLVGGIKASYRGYHTNELIRILSEKTGLEANYLYFPAFFDSTADLNYIMNMDEYKNISRRWSHLDTALISVSNYPSYPDLGVEYRFGNKLVKQKAVGRILAHYFDLQGRLIAPDVDNVMQASLAQLQNARRVIAVCSTLLRPESIIGAMHTNVIDTLVLSASLAEKVVSKLNEQNSTMQ